MAELCKETYKSACPQTMQSETAQETKPYREGEINTTCIRGYYATKIQYDPGNIAKIVMGEKKLFLMLSS